MEQISFSLCLGTFSSFDSVFVNFVHVMTLLQLSLSWDPTFLKGGIEVSQKSGIIWVSVFWLRFGISKYTNKTPKTIHTCLSNVSFFSFFFKYIFHTFYNWMKKNSIYITINLDWVGIPESILGNQGEKKKHTFIKGNWFFLVPACRFWGYKPLQKEKNAKYCFVG